MNCAIFISTNELLDEDVVQCTGPCDVALVYAYLDTHNVGQITLPRSAPYGGNSPAQFLVCMEGVSKKNERATRVLQACFDTKDVIMGPAILLFGDARWLAS